jgi:hypothetical protein
VKRSVSTERTTEGESLAGEGEGEVGERQGKCLVGVVALKCRVQLQGRRGARAGRMVLVLGVNGPKGGIEDGHGEEADADVAAVEILR